jgi:hypothetical protein
MLKFYATTFRAISTRLSMSWEGKADSPFFLAFMS